MSDDAAEFKVSGMPFNAGMFLASSNLFVNTPTWSKLSRHQTPIN